MARKSSGRLPGRPGTGPMGDCEARGWALQELDRLVAGGRTVEGAKREVAKAKLHGITIASLTHLITARARWRRSWVRYNASEFGGFPDPDVATIYNPNGHRPPNIRKTEVRRLERALGLRKRKQGT